MCAHSWWLCSLAITFPLSSWHRNWCHVGFLPAPTPEGLPAAGASCLYQCLKASHPNSTWRLPASHQPPVANLCPRRFPLSQRPLQACHSASLPWKVPTHTSHLVVADCLIACKPPALLRLALCFPSELQTISCLTKPLNLFLSTELNNTFSNEVWVPSKFVLPQCSEFHVAVAYNEP